MPAGVSVSAKRRIAACGMKHSVVGRRSAVTRDHPHVVRPGGGTTALRASATKPWAPPLGRCRRRWVRRSGRPRAPPHAGARVVESGSHHAEDAGEESWRIVEPDRTRPGGSFSPDWSAGASRFLAQLLALCLIAVLGVANEALQVIDRDSRRLPAQRPTAQDPVPRRRRLWRRCLVRTVCKTVVPQQMGRVESRPPAPPEVSCTRPVCRADQNAACRYEHSRRGDRHVPPAALQILESVNHRNTASPRISPHSAREEQAGRASTAISSESAGTLGP